MFENAKQRRVELRINTATHLIEEHARLHEQLEETLAAAPPPRQARMTGRKETTDVDTIAEQILHVEEEMNDSWVTFVLQPRPKSEWRKFRSEHPPQEADDIYLGVDRDALLRQFIPTCVTEPALTKEDWERALDDDNPGIWPGDQERLVSAVFGFYIATFEPPKSPLLSEMTRTADTQQQQLERSVSLPGDSQGGSRRSATTTSTRRVGSRATPSSPGKPSSTTKPEATNSD